MSARIDPFTRLCADTDRDCHRMRRSLPHRTEAKGAGSQVCQRSEDVPRTVSAAQLDIGQRLARLVFISTTVFAVSSPLYNKRTKYRR